VTLVDVAKILPNRKKAKKKTARSFLGKVAGQEKAQPPTDRHKATEVETNPRRKRGE